MFILNYDNCKKFRKPVFEEYYGSNKNLELGVKMLEKIVKDIKSKSEWEANSTDYTSWKENETLCKCFEREFGFKKMFLYWRHESIPNAYTIPGGMLINGNPGGQTKIFNKNKKDKYYDDRHTYYCSVFVIINMVKHCDLTARETMAIILHEIGHNFDNTWTTVISSQLNAIFTFFIADFIKIIYTVKYHALGKLEQYCPAVVWFIETLKALPYHLTVVRIPDIPYILELMLEYPTTFMFQLIIGSRAEYFSDSFAAKYGFGAETVSAQHKLDDRTKTGGYAEKHLMRLPIVRTFLNILSAPLWVICCILDPHPTAENRILAVRKELEKDLNDPDIPAHYKPEMRRQIQLIDKYIKIDQDEAIEKQLAFSALIKYITYNSPLKDLYHR